MLRGAELCAGTKLELLQEAVGGGRGFAAPGDFVAHALGLAEAGLQRQGLERVLIRFCVQPECEIDASFEKRNWKPDRVMYIARLFNQVCGFADLPVVEGESGSGHQSRDIASILFESRFKVAGRSAVGKLCGNGSVSKRQLGAERGYCRPAGDGRQIGHQPLRAVPVSCTSVANRKICGQSFTGIRFESCLIVPCVWKAEAQLRQSDPAPAG